MCSKVWVSARIVKTNSPSGKVSAKINGMIEKQQLYRSFHTEPSMEKVMIKQQQMLQCTNRQAHWHTDANTHTTLTKAWQI